VLANARVQTNICTRQRFETGYTLAPRKVPDYNFIYVTRGRVVWVVEGDEHEMSPCDLVIVPPRVPHRAFSRTRRVTLGSVHVEVTLPGGQDVFQLLGPPRAQRQTRGGRFDRYFRAAIDEFDRSDPAHIAQMMPGWAKLLAFELFIDNAKRGLLDPRPIDPVVAGVLDEVHRHANEDISLAQLAAWSGFTAQHLNRRFREVLGVTPLRYHTRLRLDRAAGLLADGRLTVRAIA
jgi:AraC-like DNA-binding protein